MDAGTIVVRLLEAVAAVAPGLLAAFGGQPSDEEAIEHARQLVDGLPTTAAWDSDLERRIAGEHPDDDPETDLE